MSNALAIATVTTALAQVVRSAVQSAVPGADVLTERPNTTALSGARVRLFLYQVSPNPSLRNQDLPTRGSTGNLTKRPAAAVDLHYLLAFYGDEAQLEPQRMLGAAVRDIHATPVLLRDMVQIAVASEPFLDGSNLGESPEQVKFIPAPLSMEDLSKLWMMFQAPYALSVAYQGTVVLIETDDNVMGPLPVLRRGQRDEGVNTRLGPFPSLERIHVGAPEDIAGPPRFPSYPSAALGTLIRVAGNNLGGDTVEVHLEHARLPVIQIVTIPSGDRSSSEVRFVLPDDAATRVALAAGLYSLSVVTVRAGTPHASNQLAFSLGPKLAGISPPSPVASGGAPVDLTITCRPNVRPNQRCVLLLADREVAADPHTADTDAVTFRLDPVPTTADALVRVRVDGVESLPFKRVALPAPPRLAFDESQRITIT